MPENTAADQASEEKPCLLVVDDSRVIRIAARKILKDEFEVLEAGDGQEALELLESDDRIRLVISDLSMPYLDGMGLLRRLRESDNHRLSNLPVIIVTGAEDDEEAKSAAFAAGASDFLTKPFDSVQLLAHARSHIKLVETSEKLEQTSTAIEQNPAIDQLTGLVNQRAFQMRGQQEVAYAIRHRADLALILVDVDDFDRIFSKYGKPAGEAILKIFAGIVKENVRTEDTGGRVGLARFGLLLPQATPVGARKLAVRICQQIGARAFRIGEDRLRLTASAAVVAPSIHRDSSFEQMLREGQRLLGRAHAAGGNRVLFDQRSTEAPSPGEATAQPAATTPDREPPASLEQALAWLADDEKRARVLPHLDSLMRQILPILEAWSANREGALDECLQRIRTRLGD